MYDVTLLFLIIVLLVCVTCASKRPLTILVLSMIGTCVFFMIGMININLWVVILAPGLFLVSFIMIGFFLTDEESYRARVIARQVLFTVLFLVFVVLIGVLFGPMATVGALVFFIWMGAMIAYGRTARRSLLGSVITTLRASVAQNLPLPMALDCAAQGRYDHEGILYKHMKKHLIRGHSLVQALTMAWPQCPGYVTGILKNSERIGCLKPGLESVYKNMVLQHKRKEVCELVHPAYPIIVLIVLSVVMSALFKYVMPQFYYILQEVVGEDLPVLTQWLIGMWINWFTPVLSAAAIILVLWGLISAMGWVQRQRRPYGINVLVDWFRWHIPFVRRFDRLFSQIQVYEHLKLYLDAGSPVDQAVAHCQDLDINLCFKRRLRHWHQAIEQGRDVSASARQCGLPRSLAWAFDSKVNAGNTPNVLDMLEQITSDKYVYQSKMINTIVGPCVIVVLGMAVCFVMVAIYLPMVSTISHLSNLCP